MTPWAVLLVKPLDSDLTIRQAFHDQARTQHPDAGGIDGKPGSRWHLIVEAYGLVKTAELRAAWERGQTRLSGRCPACDGSGVAWRRTGRDRAVKLCPRCAGEGRLR